MSTNKIKVLCVSDYYLPGYKGGGPIRTIANMCGALGGVDFYIFTRDRDLGETAPFDSVPVDTWCHATNCRVYYASPSNFGLRGLRRIISTDTFDVLYLNSFFSFRASISIVLRRWLFFSGAPPILLAPRGEFSEGALAIKSLKKKAYLWAVRLLGVYRQIHWHASTKMEAEDIWRVMPEAKIHIAPDLVSASFRDDDLSSSEKSKDVLRLVFISRISKKKNLDGLLNILAGVKARVDVDVYGPREDIDYWDRCCALVKRLPSNVNFQYRGLLAPDQIQATFSEYDLFVFPTHGENFGHVIFESLSSGTPVLISDQTPWHGDSLGAVTVIPLHDVEAWRAKIEAAAAQTPDQFRERRVAALRYAKEYLASSQSVKDNLQMFYQVAGKNLSATPNVIV